MESAASGWSFRYSAAVFSISNFARASVGLGLAVLRRLRRHAIQARRNLQAPQSFYTVTGEIALARHQPRVAALQYAAAAAAMKPMWGCWSGRRRSARRPCSRPWLRRVAARWMRGGSQVGGGAARGGASGVGAGQDRSSRGALSRGAGGLARRAPMRNSRRWRPIWRPTTMSSARASSPIALAGVVSLLRAALRVQGFAALRADDPRRRCAA